MVRKQPFYVAITRYFADETRSQVGNGEVEIAWDRYRGGLEYMMARAGAAIGAEERAGLHLRIQHLIAVRMSVAIRLRHAQGKDPLDVHTLAMRLKGMGYEHLLPVPMQVLASQATLHFLLQDPALNRGMERLVCVGPLDAGAKEYLKKPCGAAGRFRRRGAPGEPQGRPPLRQRPRRRTSSRASRSSRSATCTSCASATSATASAWCSSDRHPPHGQGLAALATSRIRCAAP